MCVDRLKVYSFLHVPGLDRSNAMQSSRSVIGANTIISPVPTIESEDRQAQSTTLPPDILRLIFPVLSFIFWFDSYHVAPLRLLSAWHQLESSRLIRVARNLVTPPNPRNCGVSAPDTGYNVSDLLGDSLPRAPHPTQRLRPGNTFLNNVTYLGGHHVFSDEGQRWIESQVGESINFDNLFSLEHRWLSPIRSHTDPGVSSLPHPELPSRSNMERFIRIYSSSSQSLVFPVISPSMFGKTLDLAYSPLQTSGTASAKACVYAFLSFVSLFGFDENIHGAMDSQSYASAVQSLMTSVIEEMTVDGLQSLIMLVCTSPPFI